MKRLQLAPFVGLNTFLLLILASASVVAAASTRANSAEPGDYVWVEKEAFIDSNQLPTQFMSNAKEELKNKNYGEASVSLRDAAHVMTSQSKGTRDEAAKKELTAASAKLEQVAGEVRSEKIKDVSELDHALAEVTYSRAKYHDLRAADEWARKEYRRAGYDLKAAADAVEDSAKWSGRELDKGMSASVRDVRDTSNKLVKGSDWTVKEVGVAFTNLGHEMESIGRDILPPSKATSEGTTSGATTSGDEPPKK